MRERDVSTKQRGGCGQSGNFPANLAHCPCLNSSSYIYSKKNLISQNRAWPLNISTNICLADSPILYV